MFRPVSVCKSGTSVVSFPICWYRLAPFLYFCNLLRKRRSDKACVLLSLPGSFHNNSLFAFFYALLLAMAVLRAIAAVFFIGEATKTRIAGATGNSIGVCDHSIVGRHNVRTRRRVNKAKKACELQQKERELLNYRRSS